jgi:hypothetical protein
MIRYRNSKGQFISKETARELGRKARSEVVSDKNKRTVSIARGYYVRPEVIDRRYKYTGLIGGLDVPEPRSFLPDEVAELVELEEEFEELEELDELETLLDDEEDWYHI